MSNFDQYVGKLPKGQGPIRLSLQDNWDDLPKTMFTVTMPAVRRNVLRPKGIKGNPAQLIIEAGDQGYAEIVALAHTSAEHIAKFEAQREQGKQNKANAQLIERIRALGINV